MKLLLTLLLVLSVGCTKSGDDSTDEGQSKTPHAHSEDSHDHDHGDGDHQHGDSDFEEAGADGIIEENDACICTKDYRPVCGSNGITYPNSCQAGCNDITEFTDGPCQTSDDEEN